MTIAEIIAQIKQYIVGSWKGAWTANTAYSQGDQVTNGGNTYRAKADFTSGSTFNAANWDIIAQGSTVANGTVTLAMLNTSLQAIVNLLQTYSDNPYEWTDKNGWKAMQILSSGVLQTVGLLTGQITATGISSPEITSLNAAVTSLNNSIAQLSNITATTIAPFEWGDKLGNIVMQIVQATSFLQTVGLLTGEVNINQVRMRNDSWDTDYLLKYEDAAGNISWGITKDRVLQGVTLSPTVSRPFGLLSSLNHVLVYGQSLSIGATGNPPITTTQKYNTLMFQGGVLFNPNNANYYNSLVPLVENNVETVASGIAEMFLQSLISESGITPSNDYRLLLTCTGQGNTSIDQLSKIGVSGNNSYYTRTINAVAQGMIQAAALGVSYNVPAIVYIQGENDMHSPAGYYDKLMLLKNNLIADIKALTKQNNDPLFIITQCGNHYAYGEYPTIAINQLQASTANPPQGTYLGATEYQTVFNTDNIHKTNVGYKQMGCEIGYELKRLLIDGEERKPCYIKRINVTGNVLELQYNLPKGQLVIDTTNVTDPGNYGFNLFNALGTEITISSVAKVRTDTIRIVISSGQTVVSGWKLTYANNSTATGSGPTTGKRGCIRDSQGDTVVFTGSNGSNTTSFNYPIYRWAAIQEWIF